jgi:hemoglobin-like flavoprotein
MMTAVLECIDRLDRVVPVLWQMGKRHGGYGVEHRHYEMVREALLWALDQRLDGGLSLDARAAWTLLFNLMAAAMEQAAAEGIIDRKQGSNFH